MKYVRTTRDYERLVVTSEDSKPLVIDGVGIELSEQDAAKAAAAGASAGVGIEVLDKAPEATSGPVRVGSAPADLSRGVGAIHGQGAPVYTYDDERNPAAVPSTSTADIGDGDDADSSDYRALQDQAKELGIPANQSAEALAEAITAAKEK